MRRTAAALFDQPASLRYDDPGADSPLDFAAGDTITLEAWVSPTKLGERPADLCRRQGPHGQQGLRGRQSELGAAAGRARTARCRISFLFRDADNRQGTQDDWHRWTSDAGFAPGSGWHHVAVVYTFGKGDSLRGYLDGRETKGKWDYGGQIGRGAGRR